MFSNQVLETSFSIDRFSAGDRAIWVATAATLSFERLVGHDLVDQANFLSVMSADELSRVKQLFGFAITYQHRPKHNGRRYAEGLSLRDVRSGARSLTIARSHTPSSSPAPDRQSPWTLAIIGFGYRHIFIQ